MIEFLSQQFEGFWLLVIAAIAFVVGYALGGLRASRAASRTPAVQPLAAPGDTRAQLRALLTAGRRLEAIRHLREATGVELADAKAAVDALAQELALERTGLLPGPSANDQAAAADRLGTSRR